MKAILKKMTALLCALALPLCGAAPAGAEGVDVTSLYKKKDVTSTWEESEAVAVTLQGTAYTAEDEGNISAGSGVLTFTGEGTWVLSGEWDGQIAVNASEDEKVRLILNGVTVTSPSGPALYESCSDKLILTLAEGTVNTFTDAAAVTVEEDEIAAAIYAEDDLSVNGAGTLVVNGNVKHGLLSRADLIIAGGVYEIHAKNDAIRGRNSVLVLDGDITIDTEGDGITSTRSGKDDKGWVVIAGGSISILAGGGAAQSASSAGSGWSRGWDDWSTASDDTPSTKGIKAETDLTILDGEITIDSLDDALHGVNVTVAGGRLTLATGDDGIHADETLTISGGVTEITTSYEGLEGQSIALSGGEVNLTSTDDGVNATAGSGTAGGFGKGGFNQVEDAQIIITGGILHMNAGGDGVDSNGNVLMTGGTVTVSGPTNSGNASVDYNGDFTLTGGTLLATGASGMMQNLTSVSGQAALLITLNSTQAAGSQVVVTDGNGTTLLSYAPEKPYQTVLVTSPEIQVGSTITVTCGGEQVYQATVSQSMEGSGSGWGGWGGGRQPGGQMPGGQMPGGGGRRGW